MQSDWWEKPLNFVAVWSYGAMLVTGQTDLISLGLVFYVYLMCTVPSFRFNSFPYPDWLWGWPTAFIGMIPCLIFYARLLGWL